MFALDQFKNKFSKLFRLESKPISLLHDTGFLDLKHETTAPYLRNIARRTQSLNLVQEKPNGERWLEYVAETGVSGVSRIFRKSLCGATLIDLGSSEKWESMYEFAKLMGVRNYVGVDKFWPSFSKKAAKNESFSIVKIAGDAECKALLIKADALEFVARLKDFSCSIVINGIDGSVINSPLYHRELARQTERIVPKGGVAFGIVSHPLSLIATNSVETYLPSQYEDPILFSAISMGMCMQPACSNIPLWEDYSPQSFDRLLIRK